MKNNNLVAALWAAEPEYKAILKTRTNPHTKSKYANLDDVIEAVKDALRRHGIRMTQPEEACEGGMVKLWTVLQHVESGEEDRSSTWVILPPPDSKNLQQFYGSSITYQRRYSIGCMLGVVSEDDDDGASADRKPDFKPKPKPALPIHAVLPPSENDYEEVMEVPYGNGYTDFVKAPEVKYVDMKDLIFMQGMYERNKDFFNKVLDHYKIKDLSSLTRDQASVVMNRLIKEQRK